MNFRFLLVLNSCGYCREYCKFIEGINMKLPLDKRIEVINCTTYYDTGVIDNPLIRILKKLKNEEGNIILDGAFPKLIYKGYYLEGSQNYKEMEQFIKTLVQNDFIIKESNEFTFNKECSYKKTIIGKKLVCN